jgi:hypothetical protein
MRASARQDAARPPDAARFPGGRSDVRGSRNGLVVGHLRTPSLTFRRSLQKSRTPAGVGASRDCIGLLTPALLLRQVRRHQAEGSREFRSGRETQLPPVDVERLLRAQAVAVAGARRPAALRLRDLCASYNPTQAPELRDLSKGASPPDERTGDVLLAAAGVCLGTSGGLDRHNAGRPCCCFATEGNASAGRPRRSLRRFTPPPPNARVQR